MVNAATPHLAFIALGSNVDPLQNLPLAVRHLAGLGVVARVSSVFQTPPMGFLEQADFCNAAALLVTQRTPQQLRIGLKEIEQALGRVRDSENKNGPRTIDLDVVCYDDRQLEVGSWQIPDPEISKRNFLAVPLAELAPDYRVPGDGRSLSEIAASTSVDGPAKMELRQDIVLRALHPSPIDPLPHADRMPRVGHSFPTPDPLALPMDLNTIQLRFCYGHRLLQYKGKCRHLHGHTARVQLQMSEASTRDANVWTTCQQAIDGWLREHLDAKMILRQDDPALPVLAELGEPVHLGRDEPDDGELGQSHF